MSTLTKAAVVAATAAPRVSRGSTSSLASVPAWNPVM